MHCRTDDGKAFRTLNILDEFSRECLAIRVKRKLNSTDVIDALTDLKEQGNSVLVVEHDESIMRRADLLIDLGPGAGQHGVASATAAALMGLECKVYMGAVDVERQALNVFRMKLLGAEVEAVHSGSKTLKDAVNEAMRHWVATVADTHFCLGSVVGRHGGLVSRRTLPVRRRPRTVRPTAGPPSS